MKCDVSYGEQVRAFEVDTLTKTDYAEHEISESPLLKKSGSGWNSSAMHQYDPWWTGNRWLVAADGNGVYSWSIGVYYTPVTTPVLSCESPEDDATGIPVGDITLSVMVNDSEGDSMHVT